MAESIVTSTKSRPLTARGRKTRQKILEAAEAVFGEFGYDRASIVEITRRAGVAQGTFYVYFVDKKSVFIELVKQLSHQLRKEVTTAVEGIEDRLEVERVGIRTFFEFTLKHGNLYKIVRQAEFVDEGVYRWYYTRMTEGYVRGLKQAMDDGWVHPMDPEVLSHCLMAIADFIGMRWVLWEGKLPPDHVFDGMMDFIVRGMEPRRSH